MSAVWVDWEPALKDKNKTGSVRAQSSVQQDIDAHIVKN